MKDQDPEEVDSRNIDFTQPLVTQSQVYPHRWVSAKIPRNVSFLGSMLEGLFLEPTQQWFNQQMKSNIRSELQHRTDWGAEPHYIFIKQYLKQR